MLIDSTHETFEEVINEMVQDFIDSGHMYKENKEKVKRALNSQHRHVAASLTRKKSAISFQFSSSRRQSTFNDLLYGSDNASSHFSRKNSSTIQINDINKAVKSDNKLFSISDVNLVDKGVLVNAQLNHFTCIYETIFIF